ncbi:heat shock 70 kDa protein-like [Linepithema humile]|uniref:heat shock 70 kDa protein-like n=1 Tax=Linepithema humile TaxID=83485 RepID=UPI00351DACE5
MLVGERNGIERENERNRKQTVTFDANGILSVSAVEKSTNKENKITITNDKRCLSREDIERMVNEAERYHAEDEKQRERVAAKNNLESYCFNMKSTTEEKKIKKISEADRKRINEKCNEIIKWMDINTLSMKEEFEAKLKEIEKHKTSYDILGISQCPEDYLITDIRYSQSILIV